MNYRTLSCILILAACGAAQANLVRNGSFEQGAPGDLPDGWTNVPGNARSSMYLIDNIASDGRQALFIKNGSSWKPGVYSSICQTLPLKPQIRYRLTYTIKGNNAKRVGFVVGERWKIRFYPKLTESYRTHEEEFTLLPEDVKPGGAMLRIITEDIADGVWIDDVRVQPIGGTVVARPDFQKELVQTMRPFTGAPDSLPEIPADFAAVTLPAGAGFYTGKLLPKPDEFQAKTAFALHPEGILFLADVKKRAVNGGKGNAMWNADSIQLHLNPYASFAEKRDRAADLEIGLSPSGNGVETYCWELRRPLSAEEAVVTGGEIPGGYRIRALFKWNLFANKQLKDNPVFSYNAIVNVMHDGIRDVAFLQTGIHESKNKKRNTLVLPETGAPTGHFRPESLRSPKEITGTLYLTGVQEHDNWQLPVEMTDSEGKKIELPLTDMTPVRSGEVCIREVRLPLARASEGKLYLAFRCGNARIAGTQAEKIDLLARQLPELESLQERFERARATVGERASDPYLVNAATVIDRHLKLQKRYLTQEQPPEALEFHLKQGESVNLELALAVEEFEATVKTNSPETILYRSGATSGTSRGLPVAPASDGKNHPLFFVGYGHFNDVIRDVAVFQNIGANLIAIETGPAFFFPKEGKNGEFSEPEEREFTRRIEPALRKCAENNVQLSLLLSPHYHPKWWLEKYPQLKRGNGLTRYEVNAPESRAMAAAYLDYLLPRLKATPYIGALHDIILTNEPNYAGASWTNPMTKQFFRTYLENKYGTVEKLNRVAGSGFASFDELLSASPESDRTVNYEFGLFRRESFADYHKFLADKVKSHLPGVPVSVKIMVSTTFLPMGVDFAADPELFAEFSDINGNDNGTIYRRDAWASTWTRLYMTHDLQYSLKPMRIYNSEAHIVTDGEEGIVPPEHIYAATFQQFLQGVGTIASWVWAENTFKVYQKDSALRGSIYHRPSNIIAHGRAVLDGNRLVEPISDFVEAPPSVALIYSPASLLQNTESYGKALEQLYTALAFTGHKIGFLSEKQLAQRRFGNYKAVIGTETSHLTADAAAGLADFARRGGVIYSVGNSFAFNAHGVKSPVAAEIRKVPEFTDLAKSKQFWEKELAAYEALPLKLEEKDGNGVGIFFRMVKTPDGRLVSIVNYNREARKVKLVGDGELFDLIRQQPCGPQFELKPLEVRFLRFQ